MKTPHPYAEILRAIADGETVQRKYDGHEWESRTASLVLEDICLFSVPADRYRIKPRTIRVGEVDVPEPMREPPDEYYWMVRPDADDYCSHERWDGIEWESQALNRGLCYSNPADAATAGRAIAALFAKDKP